MSRNLARLTGKAQTLFRDAALARARLTWPEARIRTARVEHRCDNHVCRRTIGAKEWYIDPGDSNPDSAGGFGGYRYCLYCAGGEPDSVGAA